MDIASPTNPESGTLSDGTSTASFTEIEEVILGSGDDTVYGSGGNDSVQTGDGADLIYGGAGDDTFAAGSGSDTIDGGTGDDRLTGGDGDDVFVFDPTGNDTIVDFGAGNTGSITDDDQTNNDFIDLADYYDSLEELKADFVDDGLLNQSNTTTLNGNPVDYSDNSAITGSLALQGITVNSLTYDTTNVICFARGTLIKTIEGEKTVETLTQGDLVWTQDHGYQPIRWIGSRKLTHHDLVKTEKLRPIRILAGALGAGLPEQDLMVSPQHRMLVNSPQTQRITGQREVLVAARKLTEIPRIEVAHDVQDVEYWHFLFECHVVVCSNGALSESLYTGPEALKVVGEEARDEIFAIFPELVDMSYAPSPARMIVSGRQAKDIAKRHVKNNKPLFGR